MTSTDVIFTYLALGAPFGVYQYFRFRNIKLYQRLGYALFSTIFWIPSAASLMRRYLSNAYSADEFGSQGTPDALFVRIAELRSQICSGILRTSIAPSRLHPVREVLDRYVGLGSIKNDPRLAIKSTAPDLFAAAGRADDTLAVACLIRRNQRILERHRKRARRDFINLIENSIKTRDAQQMQSVLTLAIELTRALEDSRATNALELLACELREESCNPQELHSVSTAIRTPGRPLTMTTTQLRND